MKVCKHIPGVENTKLCIIGVRSGLAKSTKGNFLVNNPPKSWVRTQNDDFERESAISQRKQAQIVNFGRSGARTTKDEQG